MTLIKISEDGLTGRRKHPFINPTICKSDVTMDQVDDYVALGRAFEANNPPYPLTEPGEPNGEAEANLVKQEFYFNSSLGGVFKADEGWVTVEEYGDDFKQKRKAWQVSKPKVETPPTAEVTEQSIGHYAALSSNEKDYSSVDEMKAHVTGFIDGANHILTSKGMVELDKVVELIETTAKEYAAEIDLYLLSKKGIEHNEIRIQLLTDLLTEIKDLK